MHKFEKVKRDKEVDTVSVWREKYRLRDRETTRGRQRDGQRETERRTERNRDTERKRERRRVMDNRPNS